MPQLLEGGLAIPAWPGLSEPGPDFLAEAARLAGIDLSVPLPKIPTGRNADPELVASLSQAEAERKAALEIRLDYLYRTALTSDTFALDVRIKGTSRQADYVPGHTLLSITRGPDTCRVMLVGKMPGFDEAREKWNLVSSSSDSLYRALEEAGLTEEDYGRWYATNILHHAHLDPSGGSVPVGWFRNSLPLLQIELGLVQPDFILCLGSEAAATILGKGTTVSSMQGRIGERTYACYPPGDVLVEKTARVMVVSAPAYCAMKPEAYDDFRNGVRAFVDVVSGRRTGDLVDIVHHEIIYTARHLTRVVDQILSEPDNNVISLDCEWHGVMPEEPGSYLRTIQFSHKANHAYVIVLRGQYGVPVFKPGIRTVLPQLKRLCKSTPGRCVRPIGHFFRADLPWLIHFGLDLRPEFDAPDTPEETKTKGGFDLGYAFHSIFEAAPSFGLETLAAKYTTAPRYDTPIAEEVKRICAEKKVSTKDLGGYGDIADSPEWFRYCAYDADVPRRIFDVLNGLPGEPGLLDRDDHGNSSRRAFWTSQVASLAFLEMEMKGIAFDRDRAKALMLAFGSARADRTVELRSMISWPDFNPGSANQCRELLFGEALNGAISTNGQVRRLRPEGAMTLGLAPIKSTGKRSTTWERVIDDETEDLHNPSTDKEVLGILGHGNEVVSKLRDVRFLDQVLKSTLKLPMTDEKTNERLVDEHGEWIYNGGLIKFIQSDGRIRSHFFPVETGRCSSSRPPLQNIAGSREGDYKRILQELYTHTLRSMFVARPGCVLIEADYKSAELAGLAWLSGDPRMISDVARNMLPESHPDYIDIHSQMAVRAFSLSCPPTKAGLKSIGQLPKRVGAKTIVFGIPYGRGDAALARKCAEDGSPLSIEEVRAIKAGYFSLYPGTELFLNASAARSVSPGWLSNPFGRLRRFHEVSEDSQKKDQERSAKNFPIQSIVADAISLACRNLLRFRSAHQGPETFDIVMQLHDALLFEVPIASVPWVISQALPTCMCDNVPIYPSDLDGVPTGTGPYHFGIDTKIGLAWGQQIDTEAGLALGIPQAYLAESSD
jgi:uracil-DNA glycosylase family 4